MAVAPAEADRAAASPEATTSGGAAGVPPLASQARPSRGVLQSDGRPLLRSTAQTCLQCALQAVLCPSAATPEGSLTIRGLDFNEGCDLDRIMGSMLRTGFQATSLGQAVHEINRMVFAAFCVSKMRQCDAEKCTSPEMHFSKIAMTC